MTQDNPSAAAPILPQGDRDAEHIYRSVGVALTVWETLEDTLATIYAALLGSESPGAARAFGTIIASKTRAEMVQTAISEHPMFEVDENLARLSRLVNEIGTYSGRRNEIAHGQATVLFENGTERGTYLCSAFYNTKKRPSQRDAAKKSNSVEDTLALGSYAYTGAQIDAYTDHFRRLNREAHAFIAPLQAYWTERRERMISSAVKRALDGQSS